MTPPAPARARVRTTKTRVAVSATTRPATTVSIARRGGIASSPRLAIMVPRFTIVSAFHAPTRPPPRRTPPSIWFARMAGAEAANRRAKAGGMGGEPAGGEEHGDGQDERRGEPEGEAEREGGPCGRTEERGVLRDGVGGRRGHAQGGDRVHPEAQHDERLDDAPGRGAEHLPRDRAERDHRPGAELPREEGERERTHGGRAYRGRPPSTPARGGVSASGSRPAPRPPPDSRRGRSASPCRAPCPRAP